MLLQDQTTEDSKRPLQVLFLPGLREHCHASSYPCIDAYIVRHVHPLGGHTPLKLVLSPTSRLLRRTGV